MTPPCPFYKRKRAKLLIAAWLALPLVYFVGSGPGQYAVGRGWVTAKAYNVVFFVPTRDLSRYLPRWAGHAKSEYNSWWMEKGVEHRRRSEIQ